MKNNPLVSVLIPVYNAGEYLRPALKSIIEQTYSNLEIIVIDDGSTDACIDTITDVKDSRIRIVSQENAGKSAALNYGLGTCISNQGIMYPDVLYDLAGIASSKRIIISIAIGYPDEDFPANRVVSTRDPLDAITTWRGLE